MIKKIINKLKADLIYQKPFGYILILIKYHKPETILK